MAWVKLDDQFFRNRKVIAAGRDARDLYLASICYAASALTDGLIPTNAMRILGAEADIDNLNAAADRLVACGLWSRDADGFRIHDYHDYNPTAEKVLAERSAAQERMRRVRSGEVQPNSERTSPNPVPRPVPSPVPRPKPTKNEGLPTGDAPQAAAKPEQPDRDDPVDGPKDPKPKPSKPRTAAQLAADALYNRQMVIVDAFCEGLGIDLGSMAAKQRKSASLKTLTAAILDSPECCPAVILPLTRFTAAAFKWRVGNPPSLAEVLAAFPDWDQAGRPEKPPPRSVPNIQRPRFDSSGQRLLTSADLRRMSQGETIDELDRSPGAFIDSAFRVAESARH